MLAMDWEKVITFYKLVVNIKLVMTRNRCEGSSANSSVDLKMG